MIRALKRRIALYAIHVLSKLLPYLGGQLMQIASHFPHANQDYTLPMHPCSPPRPGQLPVPPPNMWEGYCSTEDAFLQSGQDDVTTMRQLLLASGTPIEQVGPILEWGVASGRLIRHLADLAATTEIWGVDLQSTSIYWCREHLSPPFHFATTTSIPHLPFEDRTFGLIYAGSVFTHLDDLVSAWALELRRVLKPGGRLYFSVNDRHAVSIFEGAGSPENRKRYIDRVRPGAWERWLTMLHGNPDYNRFVRGEVQMVTMRRPEDCYVMWDIECLKKEFGPGWRWHSVTPEAYGHQTCVLVIKDA